jgi:uncharacterized protein (TIRG00374 family)
VNKQTFLNALKPLLAFVVRNQRILLNVGKYLLAFGLLAYVIWKNWSPEGGKGLEYVWDKHVIQGLPIQVAFLLAGAGILLAAVLLTLVRWYVLVRAQGLPFTLSGAMRLGLIGFFFNSFLPGSVGGDIVKAAGLAREQSRRTVAVATVIMDRAIALWGLVWFVALVGGGFWAAGMLEGKSAEAAKMIVSTAGAIVVASVVVWLLLGLLPTQRADRFASRLERLPKIGGSAAEFWRAVWMYRCRQGSVALALLLSWIGHVGFVFGFYCCALTLGDEALGSIPSVTEHFLIVPVGLVIEAMPLFPGGVGIGEAAFGGLYKLMGGGFDNGVLGSLVKRVVGWALSLGGFLVSSRIGRRGETAASFEKETSPPSSNGGWVECRSEQITTR